VSVVIVAAVARNGVIGRDGDLPWHLPGDLARFKLLTMGHTMVMGRKTFESIGRILPGRTTVVVTRQPDWPAPEGVVVAGSMHEALEDTARPGHVFVVGGAEVYASALEVADVMELTEVDAEPRGDAFFPPVDWSHWLEVARQDHPGYAFVTYRRLR
jgi:dihydrofolate reductase